MACIIDLDEWVTAVEAARRLRISRQWLRQEAARLGWESLEIGRERLYALSDLANYEPRRLGRPPRS